MLVFMWFSSRIGRPHSSCPGYLPVCLNFRSDSRATHARLHGIKTFHSLWSLSHVELAGRPALTSSSILVRHHSFASPVRYILLIVTFSSSSAWTALKYCSMSQRKNSHSWALRVQAKGLGSGTFTLWESVVTELPRIGRFTTYATRP